METEQMETQQNKTKVFCGVSSNLSAKKNPHSPETIILDGNTKGTCGHLEVKDLHQRDICMTMEILQVDKITSFSVMIPPATSGQILNVLVMYPHLDRAMFALSSKTKCGCLEVLIKDLDLLMTCMNLPYRL